MCLFPCLKMSLEHWIFVASTRHRGRLILRNFRRTRITEIWHNLERNCNRNCTSTRCLKQHAEEVQVFLHVRWDNKPALALYRKMGFEILAEATPHLEVQNL
ncbi:hypothetical protein C5167_035506 [Papaver somniferum]|uniref:N-acetyltransferase domain-containing protein n=1 Tax=Papaver somniferum TaxID=3469 RepID=A0A4Y7KJ03_PAPSO|nr:hypothetical protein C5167_035506 [Papaver somniferum]